jgi:hypothetical protein
MKYIILIFLAIAFVPAIRNFREKERGKEGEIKVKSTTPSNKNKTSDGGQYVDYEEVK